MTAGGAALAREANGRVVFVDGALPGERVRARIVQSKKDFARAVTVEVLSPSPDRVAPPCAARADGCGGCPWQHVRPSAQSLLKVAIVEDALRRIARVRDEVPVTARPRPARPRRTTVRLGVDPVSGRAGERRRGSHEVVVASAGCGAVHPMLESLVASSSFPGAREVALRVGVASGERGALVDPAPASAAAAVPAGTAIGPAAVVHESVAGAWLRVSMGSFFQSGPAAAEALVEAVADAVGAALPVGGHLLDAYAGVGLFGATVGASRTARVTAIETSRPAVADAEVNLAAAGVDAEVVRLEVGRWRPAPGAPPVDVAIADPARSGLGRPGLAALTAAGAERLVLVSCDPASLARDVALLAGAGYRLGAVDLVDAFPDTFHVETVSRFDRI